MVGKKDVCTVGVSSQFASILSCAVSSYCCSVKFRLYCPVQEEMDTGKQKGCSTIPTHQFFYLFVIVS